MIYNNNDRTLFFSEQNLPRRFGENQDFVMGARFHLFRTGNHHSNSHVELKTYA